MKERIKKVRKELNLTQQEFADKIGTIRGNIAGYETGKRSPSSSVISLMCTKFNISEDWLRTGEGEMFIDVPVEDEYFKAATQISKSGDELAMQAIIEYWKLDSESKNALRNFIYNIAKKSRK